VSSNLFTYHKNTQEYRYQHYVNKAKHVSV
jgi:hypothetical protein